MDTPQHLGLIMDGNGRWARAQGLPRHAGHRAGLEHIRTALRLCHQRGIDIVSGYLWSTENGGRAELVQVVRDFIARGLAVDEITEARITAALPTAGLPDIDLLIRTGGDQRASNFLLWQTVSAWFYSVPHYWPAFDATDLDQALAYYQEAIERRRPTS